MLIKIEKILYGSSIPGESSEEGVIVSTDKLEVKQKEPFTQNLPAGRYTLCCTPVKFSDGETVIQFSLLGEGSGEYFLHVLSPWEYFRSVEEAWRVNTCGAGELVQVLENSKGFLGDEWDGIAGELPPEENEENIMERFISDFTVAYVQRGFDYLSATDSFFQRFADDLRRVYLDMDPEEMKEVLSFTRGITRFNLN